MASAPSTFRRLVAGILRFSFTALVLACLPSVARAEIRNLNPHHLVAKPNQTGDVTPRVARRAATPLGPAPAGYGGGYRVPTGAAVSPSGAPAWAPLLFRLADGTVLCSYNSPSGPTGSVQTYVSRSTDGGYTFPTSVNVYPTTSSGVTSSNFAQLANGDLLLALHDGNPNPGGSAPQDSDTSYIRVVISHDAGVTWQPLSIVHSSTVVGLWETWMIALPSGKLLCFYASEEGWYFENKRFPNAIYQAASFDNGQTWGDPVRITGMPGSRDGVPSVERDKNGKLYCFFEAQDWRGTGISASFLIRCITSDDEGSTWSTNRMLVSRPSSTVPGHRHASPRCLMLPNGKMLVTFYSSEGYPVTGNLDHLVDVDYVEADWPYTTWTNARYVAGRPELSDRWGDFLAVSNSDIMFAWSTDVDGFSPMTLLKHGTYYDNSSDSFLTRITLSGTTGTVTASTSSATKESGEPNHAGDTGGKSIWWKWVSPVTGTVSFDTFGSNFDTVLAVYTGTSVSHLTAVSSNNDATNSKQSSTLFHVTAGIEYEIAVDGVNGVSGFTQLNWTACSSNPSTPQSLSPAQGDVIYSFPVTFRWKTASNAASYDLVVDGKTLQTVTTNTASVSSLTSGTHTWQVRAKNPCGALTNTGISFSVFDLRLADADFSPVSPNIAQPGQPLNCMWTVDGPTTSTGFWFEMFASNTGGYDLSRFGGTVTGSFFGSHSGGKVVYNPPQTLNFLPDGVYTLVGVINRDTTGGPQEPLPLDNVAPIPGKRLYVHNTISPVCDLAWREPPQIVVDGTLATLTGTVINQGTGSSPDYGFWVELSRGFKSREGSYEVIRPINGVKVDVALAPGEAYDVTTSGSIPSPSYIFAGVVDSTDLVPEIDETDNYYTTGTVAETTGPVDLEILSADVLDSQKAPAELHQSADQLTWNCTVRNNSDVDSGPVWFELFPSTDGGLGTSRFGVPLTTSQMDSIPAGETRLFWFTQSFQQVPDGIYSVSVIVNRYGTGGPDDPFPLNNRYVMLHRVLLHSSVPPTANITWVDPTISSFGTEVTVSGTIKNKGTSATSGFWIEPAYGAFDTNGIYSLASRLPGTYCVGLGPGEATTFTQAITLPFGDWVIGISADSTDIVPETDETDNYVFLAP